MKSTISQLNKNLYNVSRSFTNNLPVYTEYKRGSQISTIIRKIQGDSNVRIIVNIYIYVY